jgi:hypothetical protein
VYVSQKTSLTTFGLPPRTFLALAREGAFPAVRVGKLRVAVADGVSAYLRAQHPNDVNSDPRPEDGVNAVLGAVGLRLKTNP